MRLWLAPDVSAELLGLSAVGNIWRLRVAINGGMGEMPTSAAGIFLEVEGHPRIPAEPDSPIHRQDAGWRLPDLQFSLPPAVLADLRLGALIGIGREAPDASPWAGALRSAQRRQLLDGLEPPA